MRLEVWSITEGFKTIANGQGTRDVKDPMKALDHVLRAEGRALFVLRDFHPFLKEPAVVRRLRDAATRAAQDQEEPARAVAGARRSRPSSRRASRRSSTGSCRTAPRSRARRARCCRTCRPATQQVIESDPTFMERVVEGALGLTLVEAENVFAKSAVRTHTFDLETILEEKKQIIRKSGLLEYYEHREEFSDVGGMEILKDWLVKRRSAFSSRARDFGLPLPKGILLIGVPGTGKSLTAKAVGALWQMPLLRLDVGKIFGGLVGASEENIRKVIKTAEAIAPAILWIDELEKGFSGTAVVGHDRRRHDLARVRVVHHLAAGEDRAGVRDRDREQRPPAAARAAAQGPLRRDLLLRSAGSRGPPPDPRHPPAQEEARPGPVRHGQAGRRHGRLLGRRARAGGDRGALRRVRHRQRPHDRGPAQARCGEIVPLAITMRERIETMREWARTRARMASSRGRTPPKKEGWMARYGAPTANLGDKGARAHATTGPQARAVDRDVHWRDTMSHFTKCALKMTNLAAHQEGARGHAAQVHRGRAGPDGDASAAIAATSCRPRCRSTWAATTSASSTTRTARTTSSPTGGASRRPRACPRKSSRTSFSQKYQYHNVKQACEEKGYAVEEEVNEEDGSIRLVVRKWVSANDAQARHRDRHQREGRGDVPGQGRQGRQLPGRDQVPRAALGGDAAVVDQQKTSEFYEQSEGYVSTWAGEGKDE